MRYEETKEGVKEGVITPTFIRNNLYMTGEDHSVATELALTAS